MGCATKICFYTIYKNIRENIEKRWNYKEGRPKAAFHYIRRFSLWGIELSILHVREMELQLSINIYHSGVGWGRVMG